MIDLDYITKIYSSHYFGEELIHLQAINKAKEWVSKSDMEKQERRKSYLRTAKIHFKDDGLDYIEQSIIVTDYILEFLNRVTFSNVEYEKCSTEAEKILFRIYNMLWCEKEYILYMESPRATRVHVPMEVFQPLITEIENTRWYSVYKLDSLFQEYKKMLSLFAVVQR